MNDPIEVTTDLCAPADMCNISIVLTDAYGDGGGQIEVVDTLTNMLLGTYTNDGDTTAYTLGVCNGRDINFIFAATDSWSYENGYVITDINGEEIALHEGCSSSSACDAPTAGVIATYTVNCTPSTCRKPSDLAATPASFSADLAWMENGEATSWIVAYKTATENSFTEVSAATNPFTLGNLAAETEYIFKVRPVCDDNAIKWSNELSFTTDVACPAPKAFQVDAGGYVANLEWTGNAASYDVEYVEYTPDTNIAWLQYDNGTLDANVGSSNVSTWTWGVMYPDSLITGNYRTKVAFYEVANNYYNNNTITVNVWNGGTTAPAALVGTFTIATEGTNGMREVAISPISIDPTQNLWITFTSEATYCLSMSAQDGGANGRWFLNDTDWVDFGNMWSTGSTYSFMIRAFVDSIDLT